jgi:hypothetical protein
LARYLLAAGGAEQTDWKIKGLAVGVFTIIIMSPCGPFDMKPDLTDLLPVAMASTKWSLHLSNAIGIVKVVTLVL